MGAMWHLQPIWVFLCLSVTSIKGVDSREPATDLGIWAPGTDYLARCDFNNNSQPFCDWTQTCGSHQGSWIRTKHATPTPGTGPDGDYPDGRGYFIYQEASNLIPSDTIRLESPELVVSGEICVDFWYHMFGSEDLNELNIIILAGAEESVAWLRRGSQSSAWLHGFTSVYFASESRIKVAFDAIRGLTEYGDAALDNVAVRRGPCGIVPTTTTAPSTPEPPPTFESCLVSGDPHYYTFDKQTHHFMGNCTYTLSQLCNQTSPPLLPSFNVEATNEHRGGNTQVSYVQSVDVDVLGVRVTLEKGGTVKVDGERVVVPSTPKTGLQIWPSGFYTVVSTDFGLTVKYDGDHQVEVTLPSPYKDLVCGMCGNYNGNPKDDFLNPHGELEPDSTSLGNSWQVSNLTSCSSGPPPVCTEAEREAAQSSSFCGLITDATGPFRHCHGTIDPTGHFAGCLYDQCALHLDPGSLCRSLQSYADACLSLGVPVEPWRNATFCPISCAPNSHYESCANACPATCMNPSATCSLPCAEACVCDSGFLLYSGTCVPSHQCGCWHQGKHYPVGSQFWTDDTCSSRCTCPSQGGQVRCFPDSCPKDQYCGVQNGVPGCDPHTYGICRVHNDPHYNTFDKETHHFMGNCTYTLARLCDNTTTGLPFFEIAAKNEHRGNPSVSYVQRVLVEVYGRQIEILRNHPSQVLVNKELRTLPVRELNGSVTVGRNGRYVTLETDFRLTVSYDTDSSVEIRVPTDYFNRTCGMCGNFNNLRHDDRMMPNGEQAKNTIQLGNSWQVPGAEYDYPSCGVPPPPPTCLPEQEALYRADAFCGLLTSSQGPFAVCLSVINPESFFESCVFDLCALQGSQPALCNALGAYADACQRAGVDLPSWRNATFCPIPCPANSHYNLCTSSCPATCSSPLAPGNCSKPCVEGCECNGGFVLSGGRCVSLADCGCLAGDKYYEKGETFWQPDCVGRCRCVGNGTLVCSTETCPAGQICMVQHGILGCQIPDKATCHIFGDPHYITFDGRLYHFQGGCNYTAVEVCSNSSERFSVTTRNEHRGSQAWTALNSVAVSFRNLHIALRKSKEVYVNGAKVTLPASLHLGITVKESPPYVVVDSPFGLRAMFDGDQGLFVQVDERYKGHLCGLCGTYSGSQLDDFRRPDGILELDANEFGKSWRVTDDSWPCDPSPPILPACDPAKEVGFEDLCRVILASQGPFAACHWSIPPQLHFESCVYDQCATDGDAGQFCQSLEAYAAACHLAGVLLGDWRKETGCGQVTTPASSPMPPSTPPSETPPPSEGTTPPSSPPMPPGSLPPPTGRISCSASGDPHYTTFDGRVYNFMGNCTYTLAKVCNSSSGGPAAFDVSTTNEQRGANTAVSYISSVQVEAHGHRVSLLKNGKVNVNGRRHNLPVFIENNKIVVHSSGSYVFLETDFGLEVRFDGNHYVDVSVPPAYKGQLCGLCGNFNGDPGDDNLMPGGQPADTSTLLGDSWLVPDNLTKCSSPPEALCKPELESEIRRDSACSLITDPTGIFRDCHSLVDPASAFENCIYDLCLTNGQQTSLCNGLQAYAERCSNAGVCLEWRNSTFCPLSCPAGSHYKSCGDRCTSFCADPVVPRPCSPLPVEGCFCDEGFILSGDRCVPEGSCGCVDRQGQYHQLGESWITSQTCSERCTCGSSNSITCSPWQCGVLEECGIQDGVLACHTKSRASCHVVGDPHYYTFDKVMHTFLGTCTYTLVTVCGSNSNVTPFNISGKNEDRGQRGATYLREVHVDVYGTRVTLQKNKRLLVNAERAYGLVEKRSPGNSVSVGHVGMYMVVETDFGLLVKYDGNQYLEISLPGTYFSQVCGLCGNYNGLPKDELLMPDGAQAKNVTQFGNSWKVEDDKDASCVPDTRPELGPPCTPQQKPSIEEQCSVLQSSTFVPCHHLVKPELFIQTCIYDMCKYDGMRAMLCAILQAYMDACKVKGVTVQWRNSTFCPLPCPPKSSYTTCASPCPPTCNDIYAGDLCEKPPGECQEGCACSEGHVLSDDQCVPLSECGCRDQEDKYHKIGESWVTRHCSQKCRCRPGGVIKCQSFDCDVGEVCKLKANGKYGCSPTGFGKCLITGDPHYMTFDGLLHHFQGMRTYMVSQSRPDALQHLEPFSIEGKNQLQGRAGTITVLKELLITVYNHTVRFRQGKKLVLDGVQTVPPAQPHEGLRVQQAAMRIYLETDFGLSVSFDGAENSDITLPNSYKRNIEGLCGDFDGKYRNDFTTPDGQLVKDVDTFGESWRVPVQRGTSRLRQDTISEEELDAADTGFSLSCTPGQISQVNSSSNCGILADPNGPFQACFDQVPPGPFLKMCLFDMCVEANRTARLCPTLEQYVQACQEKQVTLDGWREAADCAPQCQPHSKYSACTSACPASCSDLAAPVECSKPCLEGCECLPGYVLSGFDCVPFRECGCTFLGRYYQVGERFLSEDCSQDCVCTDSSSASCSRTVCGHSKLCTVANFTRGCYRSGPCLPSPCLNDGVCADTSSPGGGFHCQCPTGYVGSLCEIETKPAEDPPTEEPRIAIYIAVGIAAFAILIVLIVSIVFCLCLPRKRAQNLSTGGAPTPSTLSSRAPQNLGYLHNPAFEQD